MTASPRIGFTDLEQGETIPEVVANESLRMLEQMGNYLVVKDRATAPPGTPVDGDTYLIIATATGIWAGKENQLALRVGSSWKYVTPIEGTAAYVQDENVRYRFDGSAWGIEPNNVSIATPDLDDLGDVNTGTPADGEVLTWDDGASEWVSAPAPGSGGGSGGTVPNGGTAGQVLTKQSGIDQDVDWAGGFVGAKVRKSAQQAGANYSAGSVVAFDSEDFDTHGFHDNVTNNSRLTCPAGYSYAEAGFYAGLSSVAGGSMCHGHIRMNGAEVGGGMAAEAGGASIAPRLNGHTGPVPINPAGGDYFELFLQCTDTSISVETSSYLWIRLIA